MLLNLNNDGEEGLALQQPHDLAQGVSRRMSNAIMSFTSKTDSETYPHHLNVPSAATPASMTTLGRLQTWHAAN